MPSFDIVSEIDSFEIKNTVDNAKRQLDNRWDFKNVQADIELLAKDESCKLSAESDFQLKQLEDILIGTASKRNIEFTSLEIPENYEHSGKIYSKVIKFKNGIDQEAGKKIRNIVKDSKIKVTAQIQDQQVRVQGKNRDDLQAVIALLREKQSEIGLTLQFKNFRD